MKTAINIFLETDVIERLNMALKLNKESLEDFFNDCSKKYISKTFSSISKRYEECSNSSFITNNNNYYGKANNKIPTWARKTWQYNHKIIKSYFTLLENGDTPTINKMKALCSNSLDKDLFVPTFDSNYAQMKFDGPKSHGKVFEDDGTNVKVWSEVKKTLDIYKNSFLGKDSFNESAKPTNSTIAKLRSIGASFLVSYLYWDILDKSYDQWKKAKTIKSRVSVIKANPDLRKQWLELVLKMNNNRLDSNLIGLSGEKIIDMAKVLIAKI